MNIIEINPRSLRPNPWNTNSVAPDNMEKLAASLERHGWVKPVLARETEDGIEILGGQHRTMAAIELGHETVPVLVLEDVDDTRAKEIGLIDNARYGDDDVIGLAELLDELGGASAMATFLPIGDEELAALATDISDDDIDDLLDDSEKPDPDDKPSKPAAKTHQVMRFKVPIADADRVTDFFERVMEDQGFTEEDALTNAGDALVHAVKELKNAA